jgi:hypothetical protein
MKACDGGKVTSNGGGKLENIAAAAFALIILREYSRKQSSTGSSVTGYPVLLNTLHQANNEKDQCQYVQDTQNANHSISHCGSRLIGAR